MVQAARAQGELGRSGRRERSGEQWATKALDEVRRSVWNRLRKSGQKERAKALEGAR